MMNHELRNALTGVYGWAERLVRGRGGPEARDVAAREVYEASERTITLLNNFLDLSRLDAGKVRPIIRDLDLVAVLERCFAALEPVATAKPVRLERRGPAEVPLRSDPLRLEQILMNLVGNAIRHGPAACWRPPRSSRRSFRRRSASPSTAWSAASRSPSSSSPASFRGF